LKIFSSTSLCASTAESDLLPTQRHYQYSPTPWRRFRATDIVSIRRLGHRVPLLLSSAVMSAYVYDLSVRVGETAALLVLLTLIGLGLIGIIVSALAGSKGQQYIASDAMSEHHQHQRERGGC
jgi:hypothetical protein